MKHNIWYQKNKENVKQVFKKWQEQNKEKDEKVGKTIMRGI